MTSRFFFCLSRSINHVSIQLISRLTLCVLWLTIKIWLKCVAFKNGRVVCARGCGSFKWCQTCSRENTLFVFASVEIESLCLFLLWYIVRYFILGDSETWIFYVMKKKKPHSTRYKQSVKMLYDLQNRVACKLSSSISGTSERLPVQCVFHK